MHTLIPDITYIIYNQLDFITQSNLRLVSKDFAKYPITNLFDNVPNKYKLTDKILKSYLRVIKLNASHNNKITNVNHLINLRILHVRGNCGIGDDGLNRLTNLTELDAGNNNEITNVNHLINLRILYSRANCGIGNDGLSRLTNLTELYTDGNNKITIKIDK